MRSSITAPSSRSWPAISLSRIERLVRARSGVKDVTHLIWPESAFPFFLVREGEAMAQIADLLPPGTVLIVGAARPASAAPTPGIVRAYNSIYVIDHDGAILSVYDKLHLVPFGEYLPFQDFLERLGLMQLTKVKGGYIPGAARTPIAVPRTPHVPAADLLRDRVSRRGGRRPANGRAGSSTSPMTAGSGGAAAPTSTCSRRACAPSRKGFRWCARRIPAFRRWSIRSAVSFVRCRSELKAFWIRPLPARDRAHPIRAVSRWPPGAHDARGVRDPAVAPSAARLSYPHCEIWSFGQDFHR